MAIILRKGFKVIDTDPNPANAGAVLVQYNAKAIGDAVESITASLAAKAGISHTHAIADVTGLQTALDAKANKSSPNTFAAFQTFDGLSAQTIDVTDFYVTGEFGINGIVRNFINTYSGPNANDIITTDANGKLDNSFIQADATVLYSPYWGDTIDNALQSINNNKTDVGHSHAISDIFDLAYVQPSAFQPVIGVTDTRSGNDPGYLIATDGSGRISGTFLPTNVITTNYTSTANNGRILSLTSSAVSNPNASLVLNSPTNSDSGVVLQENATDRFQIRYNANTASGSRLADTLELFSNASSVPIVRLHQSSPLAIHVTSGGNVGIGNFGSSSANSPLHIVGAAGSFGQLNIDSTASNAQSNFAISKGGTRQWVVYVPGSDDTFRWFGSTAVADAMTLTQNGLLTTTGTANGLGFTERGGSTVYQWYGLSGSARLWNGSTDIMSHNGTRFTTGGGYIESGYLYYAGANLGYVYATGGANTVAFSSHCYATNGTMNIGTGYGVGNHTNATVAISAANTFTSTSGSNAQLRISPIYNQTSGTASNTDLLINRTQTAIGSGAQFLIDAQVGGTSRFNVTNTGGINSLTSGIADNLTLDSSGAGIPGVGIKTAGTTRGYWAAATASGNYFTDSLAGDMIFRSESNRILFGVGAGSSALSVSSTGVSVSGNSIRVATARTPATATAAGTAGEICWDSNYVYVCVATNTWKRAALTTW